MLRATIDYMNSIVRVTHGRARHCTLASFTSLKSQRDTFCNKENIVFILPNRSTCTSGNSISSILGNSSNLTFFSIRNKVVFSLLWYGYPLYKETHFWVLKYTWQGIYNKRRYSPHVNIGPSLKLFSRKENSVIMGKLRNS